MPWELIDEEVESPGLFEKGQEAARNAARNVARLGSNVVTLGIGGAGDIFSAINEYVARPITEKITGKESLPYEQTTLGKLIPTTEFHRKGLQRISKGYLTPQNDVEKFIDELGDTTQSLMTGRGAIRSALSKGKPAKPNLGFDKAFSKALGAEFAGEAAADYFGSEDAKTWTKLGTLGFLSFVDKDRAVKQVGDMYNKARGAIQQGAKVNAQRLIQKLDALENSFSKGRPYGNLSSAEKYVKDQIDKVRNLVSNNEIDVDQAWAQKISFNSDFANEIYKQPWSERKTLKNLAKPIPKYLSEVLEDYAGQNPTFAKNFLPAEEAFTTLAKSKWLGNWAKENLAFKPLNEGLLHLIGEHVAPLGGTIFGASKGATTAALYKTAQLGYKITHSPTLRKIYLNTIQAAVKEDAKAFNRYLRELDERLQEEESKEHWEFVD